MITERILYLLERREAGTLSMQEQEELETWYQQQQQHNDPLYPLNDTAHESLVKDRLFDQLMQQVEAHQEVRSGRRIQMIRRWSIAASVILIAGLALYRFYPSEQPAEQGVAIADQPVKAPMVTLKNQTTHTQTFYLSDSSKAIIQPGSEISYDSAFSNQRREIVLQGAAFFDVKKDPNMPFSVSANGLKITALGTSFTVSSFTSDSMLSVKLHEGKVVVQADHSVSSRSMKPVYLKPGDELSVQLATLRNTLKTKPEKLKPAMLAKIKPAPKPASVRFEQEALNKVFDKLATHYTILITYDMQAVRDLDFTGTLQLPDEVLPVLQKIAVLNGLTITPVNKGYHLTKK